MKKIIFAIFLIGSAFSGYAQDSQVTLSLKKYDNLKKKIENLQKDLDQAKDENAKQKKDLNKQIDSLTTASQKLKKKNNKLTTEKKELSTVSKTQKTEADSLRKTNKEKRSAIEDLETKLKEKKEKYTLLEQQKKKGEQEQYERGKQEVLSTVTDSYGKLSFDEMIKASSEGQVKRDLKLVVDKELKQKLEDLDVYFSAKKVLAQKFDNESVQSALQKTKTIKEKSSLVEKLIDNLDNYQLRNEALKEGIQKIQDIDNRKIANTEKDQEEKKGLIMAEVAWYFYNYDFNNFEDYPYLSSIIIEIMSTKNKDSNTDITYILEKL